MVEIRQREQQPPVSMWVNSSNRMGVEYNIINPDTGEGGLDWERIQKEHYAKLSQMEIDEMNARCREIKSRFKSDSVTNTALKRRITH